METVSNKNWLGKGLLQVLLIVALTLYIVVDKIMKPPIEQSDALAKELAVTVNVNSQRIARLEEALISLRPLTAEVFGMKATMDNVKSTVDKIDRKLDAHIDKEK